MSTGPITILLIDDHLIIRDTWTTILGSRNEFNVIGNAATGEEGIEMARKLMPDIVLTDIDMSPVNGFTVTQAIRKCSPGSKIICVSMYAIAAYAKKIFKLGASGYVTKNSSIEELCTAIAEVYAGRKYICEEVQSVMPGTEAKQTSLQDLNKLSEREIQIAQLVRTGLSSKDIAQQLVIAIKTVEVHRYNIMKKLGLKNTVSLVNFVNESQL